MIDAHNVTPSALDQAVGWLEPLAKLMPQTVHLEASSYLLIFALLALWIWRHPPRGGGPP